jgi:hypothetical protein
MLREPLGDYLLDDVQYERAFDRFEYLRALVQADLEVVVSLICFWIALSQVSLLAHARSWWRYSGYDNSPAALKCACKLT